MKTGTIRILCLSILFYGAAETVLHAEIGRVQTKRERMASESPRGQAPPHPASYGKMSYQNIHDHFLREQYADVDVLANQYLSQNPQVSDAHDVLYLQALSLLRLNRAEEAREKLRKLEAAAPDPEVKAAASASIGDSYYYDGSHARAYASYKETMKKYASSDQKEYLRDRLLELSAEFGYTAPQGQAKNFPLTSRLGQASFEEAPFYSVQVGSFSRSKNAESLVYKLVHQGYEAYAAFEKTHGMTRVRVGRFSSKAAAAGTQARLKREGYPTKIVP